MNSDELSNLNMILGMYRLIDEAPQIADWSTKNIGTFFVETILQYYPPIQWAVGIDEINDVFTPPNKNVSWPDIALMYNLKDFRILTKYGNKLSTPAKYTEPEPCADYDIWCSPGAVERYSSFQSCFDEVSNNYQSDGVTTFRKEDKIGKAIQ